MNRDTALDRRRFLVLCGAGGAALVIGGCGPADAVTACAVDPMPSDLPPEGERDGWFSVPLSAHPALREVGGSAYVQVPEAFLDLLVIRTDAGVAALWSICTHGACTVEWASSLCAAVCPCHGSRFDVAGAVLQGPADVPLSSYAAVIESDLLWVRRSG